MFSVTKCRLIAIACSRRARVSVRISTKSKAARTGGTTAMEVDPVPSGGMRYNDLNVVAQQKWSLTLCAMLKKTLHITGWDRKWMWNGYCCWVASGWSGLTLKVNSYHGPNHFPMHQNCRSHPFFPRGICICPRGRVLMLL